jgi:pimeloyl-ACP methyl ester carboxylesterase
MPVATVGAIELNYALEGDGFPVVLIHGLAGDLSAWAPQVAALRGRHRVLSFDNRGAGRSTQADEPVTTEDLARDTLGLMDAAGIERAHIVGRSMGGAVAQHVTLLDPGRVESLVLCASFAKLDPLGDRVLRNMRDVLEWRGSWADHARHSVPFFVSPTYYNDHPEIVARIESLIAGETRLHAAYSRSNQACLDHDTLDRLGEIRCPVLILAGGVDAICSLTATRWMQERLPHAETVVFEGSSHFFLVEESERFLAVLTDWLARHTPI